MSYSFIKGSLAALALTAAAGAMAQGTPPNPAVANPATGAGQQTQQGTPMGTTGVPSAAPNTMPMQNAPAPAASMAPSMGGMASQPMRAARADRN